MSVELGLTPDARWDIDTAGLVAAAGDAGFSALGIAGPRADAAGAAALAARGLRCHELLALVLSSDEEATLSRARRLAKSAAVVSARWVLTTFAAPLNPGTRPPSWCPSRASRGPRGRPRSAATHAAAGR